MASMSRPAGCAPRVIISIRSFAVGLVSSIACVSWSKGPVPIRTGSASRRFVQGPEIDDPFGSFAGTSFHKLLPILSSIRPNREAILSFGSELRSTANKATSHTRCAKALGQSHAESIIVRENEPRLLRRLLLVDETPPPQRLSKQPPARPCVRGCRFGLHRRLDRSIRATMLSRKTRFPEHGLPLRAFQEGMLRAKISIFEAPPAAGQTENRFRPELGSGNVHEQEGAPRREQFVNVPQSRADIGNGMEHIGA